MAARKTGRRKLCCAEFCLVPGLQDWIRHKSRSSCPVFSKTRRIFERRTLEWIQLKEGTLRPGQRQYRMLLKHTALAKQLSSVETNGFGRCRLSVRMTTGKHVEWDPSDSQTVNHSFRRCVTIAPFIVSGDDKGYNVLKIFFDLRIAFLQQTFLYGFSIMLALHNCLFSSQWTASGVLSDR